MWYCVRTSSEACGTAEPVRCGAYRCAGKRRGVGVVSIGQSSYENVLNRFERMKLRAFRAGLRGDAYIRARLGLLGLVQDRDQLEGRHPMTYIAERRRESGFRVVFDRRTGLHWVRLRL